MNNLVILPGWTRDKRSYKKFIEAAPSNWKVFVPSYNELKPHKGIDYFKERLLNFLERNQLSKINLLGHSLGGALAVSFAASYRDIVKRLFLVDVKGLHKSESLFYDFCNVLRERRRRSIYNSLVALFRTLRHPIINVRLGLLAHYANVKKEATRIKVDTAIFWGERALIAPLSHGKTLRKLILNSKLFILKGVDHDWILNSPELFWSKVYKCRVN